MADTADSKTVDEDRVGLPRRLHQTDQNLSADSPFGAELIERTLRLHAAHDLLPTDQLSPPRSLLAVSTGGTSDTASVVQLVIPEGCWYKCRIGWK